MDTQYCLWLRVRRVLFLKLVVILDVVYLNAIILTLKLFKSLFKRTFLSDLSSHSPLPLRPIVVEGM